MGKRILTGAVILLVVLAAYGFDRSRLPGAALATSVVCAIVTLGALYELLSMSGADRGRRVTGMIAGAAWTAVLFVGGMDPGSRWHAAAAVLVVAAGLVSLLLVTLIVRGPGPFVARLSGHAAIAIPYVGGVACLLLPLLDGGLDYAVFVVLVAKSSDIGAYFTGKFLGRHKLAPRVSPKKTIEGAIGGVVLPALVGWWLLSGLELGDGRRLPAGGGGALLGAALAVLAVASDLAESMVKRSHEVKDSGVLFGEAGGFLDLADSLLLVGPFAVAYTALVL